MCLTRRSPASFPVHSLTGGRPYKLIIPILRRLVCLLIEFKAAHHPTLYLELCLVFWRELFLLEIHTNTPGVLLSNGNTVQGHNFECMPLDGSGFGLLCCTRGRISSARVADDSQSSSVWSCSSADVVACLMLPHAGLGVRSPGVIMSAA